MVENLSERGAELVVIDEEGLTDGASASFVLPLSCTEELSPILYILPLQVLAHDLSCLRGLNPDAPRGLSRVTETWCHHTASGVRFHTKVVLDRVRVGARDT
jgi:glutamine---fructose-6-phosphate transaminase (isomerizing)